MEKENRFYWLKLKRDFFKRHDIRIIEAMPNGKDYVLFYLKLLCESITHEGKLRFSEIIPYNEDMLATITNTNVDVVKTAIQIVTQLNLMEIMDDGTYYFNEVNKLIGSAIDNPNANRVRKFREEQKTQALQNVMGGITKCNGEIEKELDIELDNKEKYNKEKVETKSLKKEENTYASDLDCLSGIPTLQEVKDFITLKEFDIDPEYFYNYYSAMGWKRHGQLIENWQALVVQWGRKSNMQNGLKDIAKKEQEVIKPKRIEPEFEMRKYTQQEMDDIFSNSNNALNISDDDI